MQNAFKEKVLAGKTAFVAGASSGINLGIAQHFARAGAKIALISRNHEKIAAAAKTITDEGFEAIGMAADVRDFNSVETAMKQAQQRLGNFDIVISGAAGNFVAPALGMSSNGFKTVVDIDLIGTFNVLRASFQFLNRPGASLISFTLPGPCLRSQGRHQHADQMSRHGVGSCRRPRQCDFPRAHRRYGRHGAARADA